jgi:hypothetical protein
VCVRARAYDRQGAAEVASRSHSLLESQERGTTSQTEA